MMPVLSAEQIIINLGANGCPNNRLVAWAAVSRAESSWDTEAVSPTDARGLYQIEPYSWPAAAGPLSHWDDPGINSYAAMLLSGYGANFAPWDTAYANINASGRYTFLNWPETGSAAFNWISYITAIIGAGLGGGYTPPVQPGVTSTLPGALDFYAHVTTAGIPAVRKNMQAQAQRARRSYRG